MTAEAKIKGAPLHEGKSAAPADGRKTCFCGNPVPPSRSRNRRQVREHCSRSCKDAAGVEARRLGRRVLAAGMGRDEREAFIGALEKLGPGGAAIVDKRKRKSRAEAQEYIDLESMTPEERRLELGRAAYKMGILF